MPGSYPSNIDFLNSIKNSVCYKSPELIGGTYVTKGVKVLQFSGGFSTVFPFIRKDKRKIAVKCWTADIGGTEKRIQMVSKFILKIKAPYFINIYYHDKALLVNEQKHPVLIMDWIDGKSLKDYLNENIGDKSEVLRLAARFLAMIKFFHQNKIAHGDLQHGNILVKSDGEIVVIDYDSMFVEGLEEMDDNIKGLAEYQHPARRRNSKSHFQLDYFSELIIYLSLLVYAEDNSYWKYETEFLLFSRDDLLEPEKSILIKKLLESNNHEIADLTSNLKRNLCFNDISELKPLENLLNEEINTTADEIINKF
jgi:serine/threonine protein kinase